MSSEMPDGGPLKRRGLILILSSPSGAGKTSISRSLLGEENKSDNSIHLSVSVTTRKRRPSEVDGVHYNFVSTRQFESMRDHDDLLEWAEVHGNYYGTPREPVEAALQAGKDVLFDIDWQGTRQVLEKMRADTVAVFVLPPTAAEQRARLERRAEDDSDVIARRLSNARDEITHWTEYDYVLVNTDLDESVAKARAILNAERCRRERLVDLPDFIAALDRDLAAETG
ncbi:guanylate kinase [Microbaculum marinisediminis]|uniref:Guanylate kinase n=1 Tax=Microbaculum marinisediminis TaxID=2931392 RepID=A0AAW5R275_9HYPH|nr:guanylate kinase [Microbaculum sp. A6E488]MCT8973214.1 guanylate kinase [Microbaculum sp. A6E488]